MAQAFLENVSAANLTSDTIKRMYELIDQGKTDPKFQELVYDITKGTANKDYKGEIARIFNWAKRTIRYTRDPYGVEMVQDVWSTIKRERADCDDFTILLGAAVEVMGAPIRITTVSTRADLEPVHVYPEAFVGGRWIPLDATVPSSYPGWKPTQGITDRKIWTRRDVGISGYDEANVEGLGMVDPFFKQSVVPVDFGIPSDISHTYGWGLPGDTVTSPRRSPGAPAYKVARYSDLIESPAPGNEIYDGPMPIRSFPMPEAIWSFRPRPSIPMKVDPWGHMKPWSKDPNAIFPKPNVPEDQYMSNVAGLSLGEISEGEANSVVAAIHQDTAQKVASGAISKSQAENHAKALVDAVTTGDARTVKANPATAKTVTTIARRYPRSGGGCFQDMSLDWLPREGGVAGMRGLGALNLGDASQSDVDRVTAAIHTDVVNHVRTGKLPASAAPAAAKKLVDAVQTGDKSVVNSAVAPATHAVVSKIKKKRGQIRDSQGAYFFDNDESFEWLPAMYGLGSINAKREHPELYGKVHALVAQRLPNALKRRGLHPGRITGHGVRNMNGLGNLGDISPQEAVAAGSLAASITGAIAGAVDPSDATAINNAVNAGIKAAIEVATPGAGAPASTGSFTDLLKGWTVPLVVVGGIGALAWFMKGKKGGRYRSNPRRGGKKAGTNKLLMYGLAAGAAFMIFQKKSAAVSAKPGVPAPSILDSIANLFKSPGTAPAVTAAVTGVAAGVSKLFSPSPSPAQPASAPQTSQDILSTAVFDIPAPAESPSANLDTAVYDL